ncbi:hypothetical protein BDY21DRAFT_375584 [Lineolata rhizophorae]|uniref:Uncharacterized protein n=1 Tax=Lineolata rhizophorae TaxID=578093 RepID=A0A6A6NMC1_9PEZI|nr:hypothetical protein BDY21DRAFT_375584 [Lineolata rhizophorae]
MGDAACGPSNPLQNFQKHASADRSLQQDRLFSSSRQAPSQSFRSGPGPNAGLLDPEFEAFQAGASHDPVGSQLQHAPPGWPHDLTASWHPQPFQTAPPAQPQPQHPHLEGWAADFHRMHISSPSTAAPAAHAPTQSPWHQDFLQQSRQLPQQQQRRATPTHMHQGSGFYNAMYNASPRHAFAEPSSASALGKQRAADMEPTLDEEAFARAFDAAAADMDAVAAAGVVDERRVDAATEATPSFVTLDSLLQKFEERRTELEEQIDKLNTQSPRDTTLIRRLERHALMVKMDKNDVLALHCEALDVAQEKYELRKGGLERHGAIDRSDEEMQYWHRVCMHLLDRQEMQHRDVLDSRANDAVERTASTEQPAALHLGSMEMKRNLMRITDQYSMLIDTLQSAEILPELPEQAQMTTGQNHMHVPSQFVEYMRELGPIEYVGDHYPQQSKLHTAMEAADLRNQRQDHTEEPLQQERLEALQQEPPQQEEQLHQEQEEQRQQQQPDDGNELAHTAGQLLDSVADNTSQKFRDSNFLALMRRLRDREVRVEGDKMVETGGTSTPAEVGPSLPLFENVGRGGSINASNPGAAPSTSPSSSELSERPPVRHLHSPPVAELITCKVFGCDAAVWDEMHGVGGVMTL